MQALRVLLVFLPAFTILTLYCRLNFTRDPTSKFFDQKSYKPLYSRVRESQALNFIARNQDLVQPPHINPNPPLNTRNLCLGILTMKRKEKQHFPASLGSLVDSLTAAERDNIHIITFFTDIDPTSHPSYTKPWVTNLVDTPLIRTTNITRAKHYYRHGMKPEKSTLDYRTLLEACYKTRTPYIAIIEDDTIASRNWYQRAIRAVEQLDHKAAEDWLYLRLFYSETYLGWNSEEWGVYSFWIARTVLIVLAALLVLQRVLRKSRCLPPLRWITILMVVGVCVPLLCVLYFAAGRLSMQPLPRGVVKMENYGCCAQGIMYRRDRVPMLVDAMEPGDGGLYPDQRVELLAEKTKLTRWALVPSVLQHVGRVGAGGAKRKTWNFEFEVVEE